VKKSKTMPLPKLLYVCINDGSDTRINKEIKTLAPYFEVYYLGIGLDESQSFVKPLCKEFKVVKGKHKQIGTLLRYFLAFVKLFFANRYATIHVINEQLLLIFAPFLWFVRQKVVADIFDSIFLRTSNQFVTALQSFVYGIPNRIIVTDDNRKTLVPTPFLAKTVVVENYPYVFQNIRPKTTKTDELLILYSGSLGVTRGTALLENLIKLSPKVTVWLVGWLYDEPTKVLSKHPQAKYLGVKTQQETMVLASECDYILSVYEPINENNINASPNKIYDAIQAQTPVIINAEVKIAQFVTDNNLGFVMDSFYEKDTETLLQKLISTKKNYIFDNAISQKYTWEAIENKLVEAHIKTEKPQNRKM
jgi:hypothetical protein